MPKLTAQKLLDQFSEAVFNRNDDLALKLIKKRPNDDWLNFSNSSSPTPLQTAILYQSEAVVKELIKLGADVNQDWDTDFEHDRNKPPLYFASHWPNENIFKTLLDAGAKANWRGPNGHSLMMLCADHIGMVKVLQEKGEDINHQTDHDMSHVGITVLTTAINSVKRKYLSEEKAVSVLEEMIKMGASVHGSSHPKSTTPLSLVVQYTEPSRLAMAKLLLAHGASGSDISLVDGKTALIHAAELFDKDMVLLLLKNGADPYFKDTKFHKDIFRWTYKAGKYKKAQMKAFYNWLEEVILMSQEFEVLGKETDLKKNVKKGSGTLRL